MYNNGIYFSKFQTATIAFFITFDSCHSVANNVAKFTFATEKYKYILKRLNILSVEARLAKIHTQNKRISEQTSSYGSHKDNVTVDVKVHQ